ncbi:MAG: ABC transporter substrate-binding protein [Rubrobacteraceae bacterium]
MTKTIERGIPLPPEIKNDLTRREFIVGAGLITLVPGCGGEEGGSSSGDTRTIEHALGESEIPVAPDRIVTIATYQGLDSLLLLGVRPTGSAGDAGADFPFPPYQEGNTEGIEFVGDALEPNLEEIALLEPNLILSYDWQEDIYPRLSEIAPTVALKLDYQHYEKEFRYLAGVVGRRDRTGEVVAAHHERLDEFEAAMGSRLDGLEVSVVRFFPDSISLGGGGYLFELFEKAGLSRPESQRTPEQVEISLEKIGQADADVIFVYSAANAGEEEANREARDRLLDEPLWRQLEAVKAGRVHVVDSFLWAGGGMRWAQLMVEELFRYLVEKEGQ